MINDALRNYNGPNDKEKKNLTKYRNINVSPIVLLLRNLFWCTQIFFSAAHIFLFQHILVFTTNFNIPFILLHDLS